MKNNHEQKKHGNGNKQEAPAAKEAGPGDYLRALREHLRNGRTKEAFVIMQQASVRFPGEPNPMAPALLIGAGARRAEGPAVPRTQGPSALRR